MSRRKGRKRRRRRGRRRKRNRTGRRIRKEEDETKYVVFMWSPYLH
jgi:hypothetical protein